MQELSNVEVQQVGGGIVGSSGIYIGPDGAPWKDGMPIWIAIDQIN